MIISELPDEV